ncbi:MAG: argininosuccinate lyase [Angelakisella sp.]
MDKLWAGRFSKQTDAGVNAFNSSLPFDCVMYREDIQGSVAHARMLGACGIIPEEDVTAIVDGLHCIQAELDRGTLAFDPDSEDIHMFLESVLTSRIGEAGKRLHTARSRNDQVALDLRLYLKGRVTLLKGEIDALSAVLIKKAENNLHTIMPGYTHMQVAQPVTLAHHLLAYVQMLRRDQSRLKDWEVRMDELPLGSCALAGTTYPIDRGMTAQLLGFARVAQNSMDAVSDRDFCVELAAGLSLLMMHLSRLSEEIVLWCSAEFRFVELDDAFATGSSIMPQKKNPDVTELIRGKTGRVYGDLQALLTMLKGLPLAYNKDLQEDKEASFDAINTAELCVTTLIPLLETMTIQKENMREAASRGFINATDCADYLTKKGMPFRDAYRVTGMLVARCIEQNCTLETLPLADYRGADSRFEQDIYAAVALETCVALRCSEGGPAPAAVAIQLARLKEQLPAIEKK